MAHREVSDSLPDGATPLTEEETVGLIPTFVATRADLNLVEQSGIAVALRWSARSPAARTADRILSEQFVRQLHRQMYGTVWRWAGTYRTSERNIGVDPTRISVAVRDLLDNAGFWLAPDTTWISPEKACLRVHHQLVAIHPFPNGNGRHARLFTDLLARSVGVDEFTWGGADLDSTGPDRAAYLAALRRADRDPDDLDDLLRFARS
jgi:Fic-DOC domain mobile mystery protein B